MNKGGSGGPVRGRAGRGAPRHQGAGGRTIEAMSSLRLTPPVVPAGPAATADRPRLPARDQLLSVAFGTWLIVGLFVDGWAHNHQKPETIFTPWHAIFYSGFLACAVHTVVALRRSGTTAATWRHRVPAGYGLVVVGLAVFLVGGAGDLVWHSIFGIEVDVAALLSPTHLLMFTGALLILTGPFRSAWSDPTDVAASLRSFAPALLSLTLFTALVAFFFMYLTPFRLGTYGTWVGRYTTAVTTRRGAAHDFEATIHNEGIAAILLTTVIYVAPLLMVLRRWRPPAGTATILLSAVTVLVGAIDGFENWQPLLAAPLAGVVADVLIAALAPSPERPWALRAFAVAVPVALWLGFFAIFQLAFGVGWQPELWAGVTVMAALAGAGLSLLAVPPAVPAPSPLAGAGPA